MSCICSFDSGYAKPTCLPGFGFTRCIFACIVGLWEDPPSLYGLHLYVELVLPFTCTYSFVWITTCLFLIKIISILDSCLWTLIGRHMFWALSSTCHLEKMNARFSIYNKLLIFAFSSHAVWVHCVLGGGGEVSTDFYHFFVAHFWPLIDDLASDDWLVCCPSLTIWCFSSWCLGHTWSKLYGFFTLLGVLSCDTWFLPLMCLSLLDFVLCGSPSPVHALLYYLRAMYSLHRFCHLTSS